MNDQILREIAERNIDRICHFTPSRNLQHIAAGQMGILSTTNLEAAERGAFNPTDLERFDHQKGHICCSIQFPNVWYFDKAKMQDKLFPDWVVLLISPRYLAEDDTLFCPRNAAAGHGTYITKGTDGFRSMFAPAVKGAYGKTFTRGKLHPSNCPTDQQAEVLVHDRILLADITAIAVRDESQARTERVRLKVNGVDPNKFRFVIAPHMFNKSDVNRIITLGQSFDEEPYEPST